MVSICVFLCYYGNSIFQLQTKNKMYAFATTRITIKLRVYAVYILEINLLRLNDLDFAFKKISIKPFSLHQSYTIYYIFEIYLGCIKLQK